MFGMTAKLALWCVSHSAVDGVYAKAKSTNNFLEPFTLFLLRIKILGEGDVESPIIGWLDVWMVPSPSSPLSGLPYFLSTTVQVAMAQLVS